MIDWKNRVKWTREDCETGQVTITLVDADMQKSAQVTVHLSQLERILREWAGDVINPDQPDKY